MRLIFMIFVFYFLYATMLNSQVFDESRDIFKHETNQDKDGKENLNKKSLKITDDEDFEKKQNSKIGKRWALCIGINDYQDKYISKLKKCQNDAKGLADILKHEGQFDFVYTFTDDSDRNSLEYPSLNNIIAKMEFLKNEIRQDDTLIFFFSGHGISDDNNKSYLITADTNISQPYKTSLSLYQIEDWISGMKISKNIVILDACRNSVEKAKGINARTLIEEKNSQAEISAVIYSTSPGEYSYEHDTEPYGVFTTFMIDGLKGNADKDNDMVVSFDEFRSHIEQSVNKWSMEKNKKQKPYTSIKGEFTGDIVLSVIPLKERQKYNPNSYANSFRKQLALYQGINYSSLSVMITCLTGTAIGGI
ncbi:MAG TPA: caspase family protein, partial [Spirochaetota bacterium]|nr:caspase family protein [Spirochaetota bacterium]